MRTLPTPVYFYGMEPGQEISVEIDPGKITGDPAAGGGRDQRGRRRAGLLRAERPAARRAGAEPQGAGDAAPKRPKAEVGNAAHVAAPMPGVIASVAVKDGQPVQAGDLMLTIEAMKMETGLYADKAGTVKALHVQPGAQVDAKDLLVELASA